MDCADNPLVMVAECSLLSGEGTEISTFGSGRGI